MDVVEIRQRAIELEADLWPGHAEDRRGAAELLAAFADYDPALRRRALLGEAGSGFAGVICWPTRPSVPRTSLEDEAQQLVVRSGATTVSDAVCTFEGS